MSRPSVRSAGLYIPPTDPPITRSPIQCLRLPTLLTSSRVGPLLLPTSTSMSPSLSMSPNAAPRPTSDSCEHRAGPAGDVLEPSVARLRNSCFRWSQRKRIPGLRQRLDVGDVAVDRQQIEPAVVVEVEPRRAEAGERQARRGPSPERALRSSNIAGPVVDVEVAALDRSARS